MKFPDTDQGGGGGRGRGGELCFSGERVERWVSGCVGGTERGGLAALWVSKWLRDGVAETASLTALYGFEYDESDVIDGLSSLALSTDYHSQKRPLQPSRG